jgi:hypothetical protein
VTPAVSRRVALYPGLLRGESLNSLTDNPANHEPAHEQTQGPPRAQKQHRPAQQRVGHSAAGWHSNDAPEDALKPEQPAEPPAPELGLALRVSHGPMAQEVEQDVAGDLPPRSR